MIETSEKSNDDSLDIGASKHQKEGGMPSTINQSSIDPSQMSTLNNEASKTVALKSVLATEQRSEDKKFDIKVMDERN